MRVLERRIVRSVYIYIYIYMYRIYIYRKYIYRIYIYRGIPRREYRVAVFPLGRWPN